MEQKKNKRLIITTKAVKSLKGFDPIDTKVDWGLAHLLLLKYYKQVIKEPEFSGFLQGIQVENRVGRSKPLIDIENPDFSIFNNDVFKPYQETCSDLLMRTKHLSSIFLKNSVGSVWVVPTYYESYVDTNIEYIEQLIRWGKTEDTDLYLLLHDKDIYNTQEPVPQHLVNINDSLLSKKVSDSDELDELKELIKGKRVFVFIHAADRDDYYKYIVWNEKLSSKSVNDLTDLLEVVSENLNFTHW